MSEQISERFDDDTLDDDTLDEETRAFVWQKTAQAHGLRKRSMEDIVQIGRNLAAVKQRLPHGQFLLWLQAEFGMSRMTANRWMQVATRFGGSCPTVGQLPVSVLYELAAPSTSAAVMEQVTSGQIPPTLEAIKTAKEVEQQARLEREATGQELERLRTTSQRHIADLTAEARRLQRKIADLATPNVEIQEEPGAPPAMLLIQEGGEQHE